MDQTVAPGLLFLISMKEALVICTVKCGFLSANASNLAENTTSSMFLTMKLKAVSLSDWFEQVSDISRMSRALDELNDPSI